MQRPSPGLLAACLFAILLMATDAMGNITKAGQHHLYKRRYWTGRGCRNAEGGAELPSLA